MKLFSHTSVTSVQFSTLPTQETQGENSKTVKEADMALFFIALEWEGHVLTAEPVALNAVLRALYTVMVLFALKNPEIKKNKQQKDAYR